MICRYDQLRRHPTVLLKMTGLRIHGVRTTRERHAALLVCCRSGTLTWRARIVAAPSVLNRLRRSRPHRQLLLSIIWLRQYPTNEVLGYLFGVSDSTVSRILARCIPLLEADGRDTLNMPDPGASAGKHQTSCSPQRPNWP